MSFFSAQIYIFLYFDDQAMKLIYIYYIYIYIYIIYIIQNAQYVIMELTEILPVSMENRSVSMENLLSAETVVPMFFYF